MTEPNKRGSRVKTAAERRAAAAAAAVEPDGADDDASAAALSRLRAATGSARFFHRWIVR